MKNFLKVFLTVFLLATVVVFLASPLDEHNRIAETKEHTRNLIDYQASTISLIFKNIISDLRFLAEQKLLLDYLDEGSINQLLDLERNYKKFSEYKKIYNQVRYLDETGQELARVNYNDGKAQIVEQNRLQSKAGRYYFNDAFELSERQVFVSPFDLNVEHGQIEQPIKPMIRFGMPVFDRNGVKRGIVLLNYFGKQLIDMLEQSSEHSEEQFSLLNSKGYWLSGSQTGDNWAFMYADRNNNTFDAIHAGTWEKISEQESGQFITNEGLFTFATIRPLINGAITQSEANSSEIDGLNKFKADEYHWKVISFVDKDSHLLEVAVFHPNVIVLYVFMLLLAVVGAYYFSGSKKQHNQLVESCRELEEMEHFFQQQLQESQHLSLIGFLVEDLVNELTSSVGSASYNLKNIGKHLSQAESSHDFNESVKHCSRSQDDIQRALGYLKSIERSIRKNLEAEPQAINMPVFLQDLYLLLSYKLKQVRTTFDVDCPEELSVKIIPGPIFKQLLCIILNALNQSLAGEKYDLDLKLEVKLVDDNLVVLFIDRSEMRKTEEPGSLMPAGLDAVPIVQHTVELCHEALSQQQGLDIKYDFDLKTGHSYRFSYPLIPSDHADLEEHSAD